jgi:hypothetical protein
LLVAHLDIAQSLEEQQLAILPQFGEVYGYPTRARLPADKRPAYYAIVVPLGSPHRPQHCRYSQHSIQISTLESLPNCTLRIYQVARPLNP